MTSQEPSPGKCQKASDHIIIVDDDPLTAQCIADMLQHLGHSATAVHTPYGALHHIHQAVPDIIVIDINLPGIDGLQICHYVRHEPRTAHIPVVVISAHSKTAYKDAARVAGANQYLVKPVMLADLEQVLAQVKDGRRGPVE